MTSHHSPNSRRVWRLRSVRFVVAVAALGLAVAAGSYALWPPGNARPTAHLNAAQITTQSSHLSAPPTKRHSKTWRRHHHVRDSHPHPSSSASTNPAPSSTPSPAPSSTPSPATSTTPAGSPKAGCGGAPNTPGGPDPWGGCWPGSDNTGVPSGTALASYSGKCGEVRSGNLTIVAKVIHCELDFLGSGQLTIRDSKINGEVMNNGSGSVLIENTEIDGGNDQSETVGGDNITVVSSNLYGNQHEVYCGSGCTVEDSWLHGNYNGAALGWHQNGFLSTGGSDYVLRHNSVDCTGGCTSDIALIPNANISRATFDKNLMVATTDVAYCLYPSSGDRAADKPGIVNQITVTDNVFQRGSNGKCGQYGPVYGWNTPNNKPGTDGYDNLWSSNEWDNGRRLGP